jgi:hypothetical protein
MAAEVHGVEAATACGGCGHGCGCHGCGGCHHGMRWLRLRQHWVGCIGWGGVAAVAAAVRRLLVLAPTAIGTGAIGYCLEETFETLLSKARRRDCSALAGAGPQTGASFWRKPKQPLGMLGLVSEAATLVLGSV